MTSKIPAPTAPDAPNHAVPQVDGISADRLARAYKLAEAARAEIARRGESDDDHSPERVRVRRRDIELER